MKSGSTPPWFNWLMSSFFIIISGIVDIFVIIQANSFDAFDTFSIFYLPTICKLLFQFLRSSFYDFVGNTNRLNTYPIKKLWKMTKILQKKKSTSFNED